MTINRYRFPTRTVFFAASPTAGHPGPAGALWRPWVLLLLLAVLAVLPTSGLAGADDSALYEKAMDLEDRGDYEGSIKVFESLTVRYPSSRWVDDANFFIGECLVKLGKHSEALKYYKKVVVRSKSPDLCADSLYMIGDTYLRMGDRPNAVLVFEALKKNYPRSIWAEDIDKLIDKYSSPASSGDPRSPGDGKTRPDKGKAPAPGSSREPAQGSAKGPAAVQGLGEAKAGADAADPGRDFLVVSSVDSRRDPNMDSVLYEVGLNFHEKGLHEKAIEIYERILEGFPDSKWREDVHYMLGESLVAGGKYREAMEHYGAVLTGKKPSFYPDAQFMVAECYLTLKMYDKALENYRRLVELYPSSDWRIDARYMVGECFVAMGHYREAADVFRELIREFPNSDWIVDVKKALSELGADGGTADELKPRDIKKVEGSPSWKAHYELALQFKNSKRFGEAITEFEEAVRLKPAHQESWWAMGLIHTQEEQYPKAVKALERASELSGGKNPDVLSLLGYVYYLNGDYEKAIEAYKSAIASDPDKKFMRDVTYAISKIQRKMGK